MNRPKTSPVNVDYMLKQLGNWSILMPIIQNYRKHLHEQMSALERAVNTGNRETGHRLAHSIRGGAANIGAEGLLNAASIIEKKLKNLDYPNLKTEMQNIKSEYSNVRRFFIEEFGDYQSA